MSSPAAYYFGCLGPYLGHGLYTAELRRWRGGVGESPCPWSGHELDAGPDDSRAPQLEGRYVVHHRDGWTALSFWDRSADHRRNSHSTFVLEGIHEGPAALELARGLFPRIFARYPFEITPA